MRKDLIEREEKAVKLSRRREKIAKKRKEFTTQMYSKGMIDKETADLGDQEEKILIEKMIKEAAKSDPNDEMIELGGISKDANGRYPIRAKYLAMVFLESSKHEYRGRILPNFPWVADYLGVDRGILYSWWKVKDSIMSQAEGYIDSGLNYIKLQLTAVNMKTLNAIMNADLESMTSDPKAFKNLIALFNIGVNKARLLHGLSTDINETTTKHEHRHKVEIVPQTDPNKYEKLRDEKLGSEEIDAEYEEDTEDE